MAGSKSLHPQMRKHLKREFDKLVELYFTKPDGKEWSQQAIADALDISQSQVSELKRGKNAGTGALLALSRRSGKTINSLLGPMAPGFAETERDFAPEILPAEEAIRVDISRKTRTGTALLAVVKELEKAERLKGEPEPKPKRSPRPPAST